ncbi:hypothetical protein J4219_04050 [Candidatus Woesearchaeota archaeon]|nr:hypothetical protein [Candidatus Woesearchaeota archaeon]
MSEDKYAYEKPSALTFHLETALKLYRKCQEMEIPAQLREIALDHDHIEAFESLRQLVQDELHRPFVSAFCCRFPLREYSTIPDIELLRFALQLEDRRWYRF